MPASHLAGPHWTVNILRTRTMSDLCMDPQGIAMFTGQAVTGAQLKTVIWDIIAFLVYL